MATPLTEQLTRQYAERSVPASPTRAVTPDPIIMDPVLWNDWHVVAKSGDIPPGSLQRARLLETDLVLWRAHNGTVQAWADRCPHRSVRLSAGKVVENTLVCLYHGLAYDPTGSCVHVPAHPGYQPPPQACAQTYQVKEQYNLVFVCLGEPAQTVPPFPEWELPDYRFYTTGPYTIAANAYRTIENFLDVAHFPFIHDGILGDPAMPEIPDYTVSITDAGVYAKDIQVWQPDPYGTGKGDYVSYDYWAYRPLTAYLRKNSPTGEVLSLLYTVSPVDEEHCIAWMSGSMNYGHQLSIEGIMAFQDEVVLQDKGNLESHYPQVLPLHPHTEFHLPSDRATAMYRKWLRQLGVRYGVVYADAP